MKESSSYLHNGRREGGRRGWSFFENKLKGPKEIRKFPIVRI